MFDKYKLRRELEHEKVKFELQQMKSANGALEKILQESTQRQVVDDLSSDWLQIGGSGGVQSSEAAPLSEIDHYKMLDMAWRFWKTNLHARAIIRNIAKFVLGKGPIVRPKPENPDLQALWDKFSKLNKWSIKEKEAIARCFRDGELLIRKYPDPETGDLDVRFVRANRIRNPKNTNKINKGENVTYGIGTDPDDIENVMSYYVTDPVTMELKEVVPADQMIHVKILSDSDMKRGMSFLLVAMPMIKKFENWLEDRIVLNQIRSAIALVRTVEGSSGVVQSVRTAERTHATDEEKQKLRVPPRGTIITAGKGVKYEMLSPNVNASDVAADGRSMLLTIAAGCGMPEMILTADYSNANYSSSMVAQNPFVREIEDWQDFFEEILYGALFEAVIDANLAASNPEKKLSEDVVRDCKVEWPPLILADIVNNNSARQIQFRNKILSRKTWAMKEGLDPAEEEKNLQEESTKEIYKEPFQMPTAPVNQFSGGKPGAGPAAGEVGEEEFWGYDENEEEES